MVRAPAKPPAFLFQSQPLHPCQRQPLSSLWGPRHSRFSQSCHLRLHMPKHARFILPAFEFSIIDSKIGMLMYLTSWLKKYVIQVHACCCVTLLLLNISPLYECPTVCIVVLPGVFKLPPQASSAPRLLFANGVLLERGHARCFTAGPWLLLLPGRAGWLWHSDTIWPSAEKVC